MKKFIDSKVKSDLKEFFGDRDYMVIATAEREPVRIYALKATHAALKAQNVHGLSPMSAAVLGRLICGCLLLSSLIKHGSDQKIAVSIKCDGLLKEAYVECDGKGNVRGYVGNPDLDVKVRYVNGVKKLDFKSVIGDGTLTVIKDIGGKHPYTGVVPIVSGEIAKDIAYYLFKSEQIPSAVSIGVLLDTDGSIKHAGGFLVQPLGGASESVISEIEEQVVNAPPISKLLDSGNRPEDIVNLIMEGLRPHLLFLKEIKYFCPCSKEIVEGLLKNLSDDVLAEFVNESGHIEFVCKFCSKRYSFTKNDIDLIRKVH